MVFLPEALGSQSPDLSFQYITGPGGKDFISGREILMRNYVPAEDEKHQVSRDIAILAQVVSSILDTDRIPEDIHVNIYPSTFLSSKLDHVLKALPEDPSQMVKQLCIEILETDGVNGDHMSPETQATFKNRIKHIKNRYPAVRIGIDDLPIVSLSSDIHSYFASLIEDPDIKIDFIKLDGGHAISYGAVSDGTEIGYNGEPKPVVTPEQQDACVQAYVDAFDILIEKGFDGYIIIEGVEHEEFYVKLKQKTDAKLDELAGNLNYHISQFSDLNLRYNALPDETDQQVKHTYSEQISHCFGIIKRLQKTYHIYEGFRHQGFYFHRKQDLDTHLINHQQIDTFIREGSHGRGLYRSGT